MTKATIKEPGKAAGELSGQRHEHVGGKTAKKPKRKDQPVKASVKGSQKKPRRGTERDTKKVTKDQSSPLHEAYERGREQQDVQLDEALGAAQHHPEDLHGKGAEPAGS